MKVYLKLHYRKVYIDIDKRQVHVFVTDFGNIFKHVYFNFIPAYYTIRVFYIRKFGIKIYENTIHWLKLFEKYFLCHYTYS